MKICRLQIRHFPRPVEVVIQSTMRKNGTLFPSVETKDVAFFRRLRIGGGGEEKTWTDLQGQDGGCVYGVSCELILPIQ